MTRWYYKSALDELRDIRCYIDAVSSRVAAPETTLLLPADDRLPAQLLPAQRAGLRVNVSELGEEIIVSADMIPGVTKQEISLDLINPQALEISSEGWEERTEETGGYLLRERGAGSMTRIVPLPKPVSEDGAVAVFRDGILEVRLKKRSGEFRRRIEID